MDNLIYYAFIFGLPIVVIWGIVSGLQKSNRDRQEIWANSHNSVTMQFAARMKHAPTATSVRSTAAKWKTEAEMYAEPMRSQQLRAADSAAAAWFLAEADRLERDGDAWKALEALQAARRYTDTTKIRSRIDRLMDQSTGL